MGTASDWDELVRHARGLVQMMRSATPAIALDYGALADQLIALHNPERAADVRLRWGRDFYRVLRPSKSAAR